MRTLILGALLAALAACSAVSRDQEKPVTEAELRGARLLAEGKAEEALEVFRSAAYDEGSYRGLVGMAHCYARLGDEARFETISMEAASRSPRTLESQRRLGTLFVKGAERFRMRPSSRRFAQVGIEYLRRVYAVSPQGDPDLLPTLGLGLLLADMNDGAAVILNQALFEQPDRVDVVHSLVTLYRRQGDRARMLRLLEPWKERGDLPEAWREALAWASSPAGEQEHGRP
ncbi:MAG: hypothetical protein H6807_04765 [Planctomycetes bacterium]|nr:hypothetical protein [Planctomycetota bacterium]